MLLNLYLAFFVSRRAQFKPKRERAETERRGSGLRRESALFFRSWCRFNAAILYFIFKKKKTELFSSFFFIFYLGLVAYFSPLRSAPVRPFSPLLRLPAALLLRQRIKGPRLGLRHGRVTPRCVRLRQPRARAEKRNRIVYVIFFFIIHKVQLAYTLTQRRRDDLQRETSQLVYK